jgi:hypothetical protein
MRVKFLKFSWIEPLRKLLNRRKTHDVSPQPGNQSINLSSLNRLQL